MSSTSPTLGAEPNPGFENAPVQQTYKEHQGLELGSVWLQIPLFQPQQPGRTPQSGVLREGLGVGGHRRERCDTCALPPWELLGRVMGSGGGAPSADGLHQTMGTGVLLLQQRVSVAPDRAPDSRAAAGEGTGRGYRAAGEGEPEEGRSQTALSLSIDLVGSICES